MGFPDVRIRRRSHAALRSVESRHGGNHNPARSRHCRAVVSRLRAGGDWRYHLDQPARRLCNEPVLFPAHLSGVAARSPIHQHRHLENAGRLRRAHISDHDLVSGPQSGAARADRTLPVRDGRHFLPTSGPAADVHGRGVVPRRDHHEHQYRRARREGRPPAAGADGGLHESLLRHVIHAAGAGVVDLG